MDGCKSANTSPVSWWSKVPPSADPVAGGATGALFGYPAIRAAWLAQAGMEPTWANCVKPPWRGAGTAIAGMTFGRAGIIGLSEALLNEANRHGLTGPLVGSAAGFCSGVMVTFITHPLVLGSISANLQQKTCKRSVNKCGKRKRDKGLNNRHRNLPYSNLGLNFLRPLGCERHGKVCKNNINHSLRMKRKKLMSSQKHFSQRQLGRD